MKITHNIDGIFGSLEFCFTQDCTYKCAVIFEVEVVDWSRDSCFFQEL